MAAMNLYVSDLEPGEAARPPDAGAVHRASLSAFVATFFVAWLLLDRLVTSPPLALGSLVPLTASALVLLCSERLVTGLPVADIGVRLGLGAPALRGVAAALAVGAAVVATFVGGAAALGIHLDLRSNWPDVLVGALLFHGIAEELVWRGYVYGELRRTASFRQAIAWSTPLIALTHVPIVVSNGVGVGSLAVLTAIVTCLPFAYLYDRGRRTVWPPAIVHGAVGTWQLFERTFPVQFSVLIMCGSIITPLAAFLFGDRFFHGPVAAHQSSSSSLIESTNQPISYTEGIS
jgi:membrane protease YdiL (CAAX protease family)